jgi:hypothetical protein
MAAGDDGQVVHVGGRGHMGDMVFASPRLAAVAAITCSV